MPAQLSSAGFLVALLTALFSPPASPTGPPCRLTARSQSSIRTDCWSLFPEDIPQSTEPPLCLHQKRCSGVHWSKGERGGRVFFRDRCCIVQQLRASRSELSRVWCGGAEGLRPARTASRPPAGTSWPSVWGTTQCLFPSEGSAAASGLLSLPVTRPRRSAALLTATCHGQMQKRVSKRRC